MIDVRNCFIWRGGEWEWGPGSASSGVHEADFHGDDDNLYFVWRLHGYNTAVQIHYPEYLRSTHCVALKLYFSKK